jgi:hypothetical protein
MAFSSTSSTRKARRKEAREQKKAAKRAKNLKDSKKTSKKNNNNSEDKNGTAVADKKRKAAAAASAKPERSPGKKARRTNTPRDPYAGLPPEVAAAMREDDNEIADLERKLGLASGDNKNRLNNEYAKKECFGEDFGNFLDDLDLLVKRVISGTDDDNDAAAASDDGSHDDSGDSDDDEDSVSSVDTSESEQVEKTATE